MARAITTHMQQSEEARSFWHWAEVFGLKVQAIMRPASETEAQAFREDADIMEQSVASVDGVLVAVK